MEANKFHIIFANIWQNDEEEGEKKKKWKWQRKKDGEKTTLHNGKNIFPSFCLSPFMTFRFLVKLCCCCCCCFFISSSKRIFFASLVFSSFELWNLFFSVYVIPKIMSYSHLSGRVNARKKQELFFLALVHEDRSRNDNMRIWFVKRCDGMCMVGVKLKYNTVNVSMFKRKRTSGVVNQMEMVVNATDIWWYIDGNS